MRLSCVFCGTHVAHDWDVYVYCKWEREREREGERERKCKMWNGLVFSIERQWDVQFSPGWDNWIFAVKTADGCSDCIETLIAAVHILAVVGSLSVQVCGHVIRYIISYTITMWCIRWVDSPSRWKMLIFANEPHSFHQFMSVVYAAFDIVQFGHWWALGEASQLDCTLHNNEWNRMHV